MHVYECVSMLTIINESKSNTSVLGRNMMKSVALSDSAVVQHRRQLHEDDEEEDGAGGTGGGDGYVLVVDNSGDAKAEKHQEEEEFFLSSASFPRGEIGGDEDDSSYDYCEEYACTVQQLLSPSASSFTTDIHTLLYQCSSFPERNDGDEDDFVFDEHSVEAVHDVGFLGRKLSSSSLGSSCEEGEVLASVEDDADSENSASVVLSAPPEHLLDSPSSSLTMLVSNFKAPTLSLPSLDHGEEQEHEDDHRDDDKEEPINFTGSKGITDASSDNSGEATATTPDRRAANSPTSGVCESAPTAAESLKSPDPILSDMSDDGKNENEDADLATCKESETAAAALAATASRKSNKKRRKQRKLARKAATAAAAAAALTAQFATMPSSPTRRNSNNNRGMQQQQSLANNNSTSKKLQRKAKKQQGGKRQVTNIAAICAFETLSSFKRSNR